MNSRPAPFTQASGARLTIYADHTILCEPGPSRDRSSVTDLQEEVDQRVAAATGPLSRVATT